MLQRLLALAALASLALPASAENPLNGGSLPPATGEEGVMAKARSDENLAVMVIVAGAIGGLVLLASLVRGIWNSNVPRPRKPWDNL